MPGPEYADYCNDDFPVLSFAYALFCDHKFRTTAHAEWLKSLEEHAPKGVRLTAEVLKNPKIYDDYLLQYIKNRGVKFPQEAIDFIKVTVATNPPEKGLYAPTKEQGAWFANKFLVPELMGDAGRKAATAAATPAPPKPAKSNGERPLIACLAQIFVNVPPDPAFVTDPEKFLTQAGITKNEKDVLLQFHKGKSKHLTKDQAEKLVPGLAREFSMDPYVW
jgi:hypothetical protein